MPSIAFATAISATGHDEDLPLLLAACRASGVHARALAWDDASVSWGRFDAVVLRSTWDYTEHLQEFLGWCEHTSRQTILLNPLPVIRWNADKRYLADLAALGIPVIPTRVVEPDAEPLPALHGFLQDFPGIDFVVKPAVSAGGRDTQRYAPGQEFAASNHLARLLDQQRSVLLQPYQPAVDRQGETALVYLAGVFSHAVCKPPLLATATTPLADGLRVRVPDDAEQALAERALEAVVRLLKLDAAPCYARVDLIAGEDGSPQLLELELIEPSLFLPLAPATSAAALVAHLRRQLSQIATVRARMA